MTTFDDDYVEIHARPVGGSVRRAFCKDVGLTWPPPELWVFQNMRLIRQSISEITDEQRARMTHVMRGALYVLDQDNPMADRSWTPLAAGTECSLCGYPIDAATALNSEEVGPDVLIGELSICVACGNPDIFTNSPDGPTVRPPTEAELRNIAGNAEAQAAMTLIRFARMTNPKHPKGPRG